MTVVNPPLWMQGGTYPAVNDRVLFDALLPAYGDVGDLGGGVLGHNQLAVTPLSGMNLNVSGGFVSIIGENASGQGKYLGYNNGNTTVTVATANATNPRIDLVVARIRDNAYIGGGVNTWALEMVTGTAAPSPAAPARPLSSVILAQVSVPAADTTIDAGQITDKRVTLAGPGGMFIYPDSASVIGATNIGIMAWRRAQRRLYVPDGTSIQPTNIGNLMGVVVSRSTTSGTWATTNWAAISMGTEDYDPEGMHNLATDPFIIVPHTGWWEINWWVLWGSEATGNRAIGVHVGAAYTAPSTPNNVLQGPNTAVQAMRQTGIRKILLTAGDRVTGCAWHSNGSNIAVEAARLEVVWVGGSA